MKVAKKPNLNHIIEPLRQFAVPINKLTLDPTNARKHDEVNKAATENSLRAFGQRLPIIVQKQGMIVRVGNNRVEIAKERLGWKYIAAIVVDEDDVDAARYAIADNRTAELADWDYAALSSALRDITQSLPEFTPSDLSVESLVLSEFVEQQAVEVGAGNMPRTNSGNRVDSKIVEDSEDGAVPYVIVRFTCYADYERFCRKIGVPNMRVRSVRTVQWKSA